MLINQLTPYSNLSYFMSMHAAQLIDTSGNISLRKSTYEALKRFLNENPFSRYFHSKFFCMNNVDILFLGETKLDFFFPDAQFLLRAAINHSRQMFLEGPEAF